MRRREGRYRYNGEGVFGERDSERIEPMGDKQRRRVAHPLFYPDADRKGGAVMSAPLPSFAAGEVLTAAKLNALAARVRELLQRRANSGGVVNLSRRVIPGRHYAFELGELSGVLYFRQGWIDPGTGALQAVGEKEWNPIGRVKPCTVWLEMAREGDACTAAVVQGEFDATTPESNLRRRLGYVREAEGPDGVPVWHCVQVCGGVMRPCAPRRVMGVVNPDAPAFCACDESWNYRHAGAITGEGYTVGENEYSGRRVVLGYSNGVTTAGMPVERGGDRFALDMGFACNI